AAHRLAVTRRYRRARPRSSTPLHSRPLLAPELTDPIATRSQLLQSPTPRHHASLPSARGRAPRAEHGYGRDRRRAGSEAAEHLRGWASKPSTSPTPAASPSPPPPSASPT